MNLSLRVSLLAGLGLTLAPGVAHAKRPHTIVWTGRVDSVVDVYFQRGRSWTKVVSGKDQRDGMANRIATLPRRNILLFVNQSLGRGDVEIRQQPRQRNGYTAIVRVTDRKGGADRYRFNLRWDD